MKRFEYADELISEREIMIAIPSIVIGIGILALPRFLASVTIAADGWISILLGGMIAVGMTWVVAKLAARFPHQSFLTYASRIVTKPVAVVLTLIFTLLFSQIVAYQVRDIADISKQYLFNRTPVEVLALAFLLVVVYAVSGSRAGLFRLNMMFFPIILVISSLVVFFSSNQFEAIHLYPMFETSLAGHIKGLGAATTSYIGFSILWFYISLVKEPSKAPKFAVVGMCIPVALYMAIFIACVGVFGNEVTQNLIYPMVELAKGAEIPGEFFERFESVFFTIWIMAIFNTTSLALDISVFTLTQIFKNTSKYTIIFILSPLVYLIAMYPQNLIEVFSFGTYIGYAVFGYTLFVTVLLIVVGKLRGVDPIG